ncbi:tRNA isopentenyl-2-thiomethyl-A-37 hydroxylase MiaE [Neiella marina]|uniref:tRNA isopentenyl-2-thiomethyl-A-37 hydroxylase MiaE n=1 Tax=Neiella holothuriorum TaxID=2870530 RepID=A0ABS7EDI0_9GAMM|nr:tRNA isopentenyl-2-thiomethyl-A-37 hydroxylase MiaE [Neiella holothuriorum]MBW8190399.1 tRNA isopentenyl-2-thiomethyl-A-37 hydroxylase MiaE [Neiella holothuriorum]
MQTDLIQPIVEFLQGRTPEAWLTKASQPEQLPALLIDHCNCELKAAQTAMLLIRRYAVSSQSSDALLAWLKPYEDFVYRKVPFDAASITQSGLNKKLMVREDVSFGHDLVDKMVLLIKEELHHFQQVLEILEQRGIAYESLGAGRYAKGMMRRVRTYEPQALIDKLICGAIIEARSCERFAALVPYIDDDLGRFYTSLLRSEARHFEDYLTLAQQVAGDESIQPRVDFFTQLEGELIASLDDEFRFHSGVPA